jgi:hypothetical protein
LFFIGLTIGRSVLLNSNNLLAELSEKHKGKYSDKWSSYLEVYWNLFEPICNGDSDLLEIGIQNGGSLEIWAKLFPNAGNLVGIDNNPKCSALKFDDPRIKVFVEDGSDITARNLVREAASNLGVVIDDGSHISSDIIRSFLLFFPQLRPGGIYVIEDLHASYWLDWEGGLSHPQSSMQFLKLLADVVNFDHWGIGAARTELFALIDSTKEFIEEETLSEIDSVQFMDSVCVIRKKQKSHIGLGPRIGSGVEAVVVEEIRDSLGQTSTPPAQDSNPFSRPSDLSVGWLESVKRQNQELATLLQELTAERDQLTAQRDQLTAQLEAQKLSIQAMKNTLSWRITKPLRYLRSFGSKNS